MSAAVGDIGWWTALRQDQRARIADLRATVTAAELSPIGGASINQWIDEAAHAWIECNTPGVERNLELARALFDAERCP
jgi:hypothetical protein